APAENPSQVLPAMNSLGENRHDAPRSAFHLQRRHRDYYRQEQNIEGMHLEKKTRFLALRIMRKNRADARQIDGHHQQGHPLASDKVCANQHNRAHSYSSPANSRSASPSATARSPRSETA